MRFAIVMLSLGSLAVLLAACGDGGALAESPAAEAAIQDDAWPPVATFSIVAYDERTGDLGIAVQSKFLGVGAVVPWAKAGVGAVATQAFANVRYGPDGLKMMEEGKTARETVEALTAADEGRGRRQVGIVDAKGNSASFTGPGCNDWAGGVEGKHFCAQGNILAGEPVVKEMARAFEEARAQAEEENTGLEKWLMAALYAGQEAGGDRRGKQSAAILIVREGGGYGGGSDRYIDLRVEDHPEPIKELDRLIELHRRTFRRGRGR